MKSWNGFCSCSKRLSVDGRRLLDVVDVGHDERYSLVLFFIGNEKSFRGQQLTSIFILLFSSRRIILYVSVCERLSK